MAPVRDILIGLLITIFVILFRVNIRFDQRSFRPKVREFLDHYLGAFNFGLMLYIYTLTFRVQHEWLLAMLLFSGYFALSLGFYGQFKTGKLIQPRIREAFILFIALLFFLNSFPDITTVLQLQVFNNLTLAEIVLIICMIGLLIFSVFVLIKIKSTITYGIWLFAAVLAMVCCFSVMIFSRVQLLILITMYACWYIGRLKRARLINGVERSAGLFTPLILIVAYFWDRLNPTPTFIIVLAYIALNSIILLFSSLRYLFQSKIDQ
ncbi:MAG: hypothetical protein R3345_01610 [Fulvivirga sp.]|nr:hypothetical protein [Fulvivirga sp.]